MALDIAKITFALDQVEFVMEAVTFSQFIMEEALQTAFFALNMAISNKQNDLAKMCIDLIAGELLPQFQQLNRYVGWIAFYSWDAFSNFGKSCTQMLNVARATLNYWGTG